MKTFSPHTSLEPFVESYWAWELPEAIGELDPILPDAAPELIVHLATPPRALRSSGQWQQQHCAYLLCASQCAVRLAVEAPMSVFAIRFRPWGVSRFTARPMDELIDREIPPGTVFPQFGEQLVDGIRCASSLKERVSIADLLLQEALLHHSEKDELIRQLHRNVAGGVAKGHELAAALGVSERSIRRIWHDTVGSELRKFVSLMRFHRALGMIDAGAELSVVAAECGYADQPHLARDVKRISGLPASLLRIRLGSETYCDLYSNRPSAPWRNS